MTTIRNIKEYFQKEEMRIKKNQTIAKNSSLDIVSNGIFELISIKHAKPIDYNNIRTGIFEAGSERHKQANDLTTLTVKALSENNSIIETFTSEKKIEGLKIGSQYSIIYHPAEEIEITLQHPRQKGYIRREPETIERLSSIKPYSP